MESEPALHSCCCSSSCPVGLGPAPLPGCRNVVHGIIAPLRVGLGSPLPGYNIRSTESQAQSSGTGAATTGWVWVGQAHSPAHTHVHKRPLGPPLYTGSTTHWESSLDSVVDWDSPIGEQSPNSLHKHTLILGQSTTILGVWGRWGWGEVGLDKVTPWISSLAARGSNVVSLIWAVGWLQQTLIVLTIMFQL